MITTIPCDEIETPQVWTQYLGDTPLDNCRQSRETPAALAPVEDSDEDNRQPIEEIALRGGQLDPSSELISAPFTNSQKGNGTLEHSCSQIALNLKKHERQGTRRPVRFSTTPTV
jgi:hypothetical protein